MTEIGKTAKENNRENSDDAKEKIVRQIIATLSSEAGCDPGNFDAETPLSQIGLNRKQNNRVNLAWEKKFRVDLDACMDTLKREKDAPSLDAMNSFRLLAPFSKISEKIYLKYREPISEMTIGSLAASIAAGHLVQSELVTGYRPRPTSKRGVITWVLFVGAGFPIVLVLMDWFAFRNSLIRNITGSELFLFFLIMPLPMILFVFLPGMWALWRAPPKVVRRWTSTK